MPSESCVACPGPYFAVWQGRPLCKDCWNIATFEEGFREHDRPGIEEKVRLARAAVAARKAQEGG